MAAAPPLRFLDATHVRGNGGALLYFGGCNYLGLSWHPAVRRALARAALKGPLQPGASRATTGELPPYRRFERRLAKFFHAEDAAYLVAGYLAPLAACHALAETLTHVLLDDRAHPCMNDAARAAGRPVAKFAHGDTRDLRVELAKLPRGARPLVACDGTCGIGGGITPMDAYLGALPRGGRLLVDDAHGGGAVGPHGRGACALLGLDDPRIVQTISLAKAFGVGGGAVLGPAEVTAAVRGRAATFVGTTAPLLPVIAALEASLAVLRKQPQRIARLQANARLLHELLPACDQIQSDPRTPIIGVFPNSPAQARALQRALLHAGIYPSFIRYLTGPVGGFLRLAVNARHTPVQIQRLARVLGAVLRDRDT